MGWMAALVGSLAVAAAGMGQANDGQQARGAGGPGRHFGAGHRGERIERELNLTDKQKAAWKQIHDAHFQSIKPLIDQERQIHTQIREQLDSGNADAEAIGKLMISAHDVGKQFQASRDELDAKLSQVLTPDQKTKFDAMKQRRMERRHGFGGPEATPES